jgi:thiol-disulfide isomerase/thioredoxin
MKKFFFLALAVALCTGAYAQKSTSGIVFSTCVNNRNLPADFHKGKILVLDAWATWCGPCIASFPKLDALAKRYKNDQRFVFASLTSEEPKVVEQYYQRRKDRMPDVLHLVDKAGATWRYLGITMIPRVFAFAQNGELIYSGSLDTLEHHIKNIAEGKPLPEQPAAAEEPQANMWEALKERADYIAITGPSDAGMEASYNSSIGRGGKDVMEVMFEFRSTPLADVVSAVASVSAPRIRYSNEAKSGQKIDLIYKQEKNSFPEYNKGVLPLQYQNHILHLLQQQYGFSTSRTKERTAVLKIVVAKPKLLQQHTTISTKGSFSSSTGEPEREHHFVNQALAAVAAATEDELGMIVIADEQNTAGYDLDISYKDFDQFKASLAKYGLEVQKLENYEVEVLRVVFE